MPNEADHLEARGDKESKKKEEEERMQGAPEATLNERIRANSSSPHRGNTPQGEKRIDHTKLTRDGKKSTQIRKAG